MFGDGKIHKINMHGILDDDLMKLNYKQANSIDGYKSVCSGFVKRKTNSFKNTKWKMSVSRWDLLD